MQNFLTEEKLQDLCDRGLVPTSFTSEDGTCKVVSIVVGNKRIVASYEIRDTSTDKDIAEGLGFALDHQLIKYYVGLIKEVGEHPWSLSSAINVVFGPDYLKEKQDERV